MLEPRVQSESTIQFFDDGKGQSRSNLSWLAQRIHVPRQWNERPLSWYGSRRGNQRLWLWLRWRIELPRIPQRIPASHISNNQKGLHATEQLSRAGPAHITVGFQNSSLWEIFSILEALLQEKIVWKCRIQRKDGIRYNLCLLEGSFKNWWDGFEMFFTVTSNI